MRRKIITFVLLIATFLLQSTLVQALPIRNATPNLLLILTVSFALLHGRRTGMWVGFFAGLLIDLFYSNLFGFHALVYMYVGYLNGFLYQVFFDEDIKVPILFVAISDLCYNLIYYVIQFAFRMRFDFGSYLTRVILPEMVYTALLTILFYRLFHWINKKMVRHEQEEQHSPWLRR